MHAKVALSTPRFRCVAAVSGDAVDGVLIDQAVRALRCDPKATRKLALRGRLTCDGRGPLSDAFHPTCALRGALLRAVDRKPRCLANATGQLALRRRRPMGGAPRICATASRVPNDRRSRSIRPRRVGAQTTRWSDRRCRQGRDFWRRRRVATPLSLQGNATNLPRCARSMGEPPPHLCERAARAIRPHVHFGRLVFCAERGADQKVTRTRRSIVRDCTIEWGSSYILNSPNALSPKACLPSCSMNPERRKRTMWERMAREPPRPPLPTQFGSVDQEGGGAQ